MSKYQKEKCLKALTELHNVNVFHGDIRDHLMAFMNRVLNDIKNIQFNILKIF